MHRRGLGKSHGGFFKRIWGYAAFFIALIWLPSYFFPDAEIAFYERVARSFGLSCETVSFVVHLLLMAIFTLGLGAIVHQMRAAQSRRVGHTVNWKISADSDGLLYASRNLDYILRWAGIYQVLAEPEGIVIVHGNSYFFVPNEAFDSAAERQAFIHLLAENMPADAVARSGDALELQDGSTN